MVWALGSNYKAEMTPQPRSAARSGRPSTGELHRFSRLIGYNAGMTRSNIMWLCRFLLCLCAVVYVFFGNTLSRSTVWGVAVIVLILLAVEAYEFKSRRAEARTKQPEANRLD